MARRTGRHWLIIWACVPTVLAASYFLLPLDVLGPQRAGISWVAFGCVLGLIAVLLLRQVRDVLVDRTDSHPAVVIPLLMAASVLTFAATYLELSRRPGEFEGLSTRIDALYFTLVTLATVGYGDITPRGQAARVVTMLQILYTFVFLTAGATAVSQRLRRVATVRAGRRGGGRGSAGPGAGTGQAS